MLSRLVVARGGAGNLSARALHGSSASRHQLYNDVTETIGNTPIVRVNRMAPEGVELYAKLEYFNPLSSVKDRLAIAVIEDGEKKGLLKPGSTVVEATSGNTGIALAMVCAAKGYRCVITMAEPFSVERRKIMRMLGAKVVITPAAERGTGMVKKAQELAKKNGWFSTRQFENEANAEYHAKTTAPEILRAFGSKQLDYLVLGYGTGGTFAGVSKVLRVASPGTKIVLSEPSLAPLLHSGTKQERQKDGSSAKSHPSFTPHPIQGWTPDFIPLILEKAVNEKGYDMLMKVDGKAAMEAARQAACKEGIFTGISGGANLATSIELAKTVPKGSTILTILADTAERYLSTPLFEAIAADMSAEELEISKSTPGFQLPPKPAA
jgi:cysteine synthase A